MLISASALACAMDLCMVHLSMCGMYLRKTQFRHSPVVSYSSASRARKANSIRPAAMAADRAVVFIFVSSFNTGEQVKHV